MRRCPAVPPCLIPPKARQHTAVDLGEEEFTVGRPHPMIDNDLRIRRLLQEARDPEVAVIMLDVVLGYGAHPDPASELGKAVEEAQKLARGEGRELICCCFCDRHGGGSAKSQPDHSDAGTARA